MQVSATDTRQIISPPPAVAAADLAYELAVARYDAVDASLTVLRGQLAVMQDLVRQAEEQEGSAGLHLGTAGKNQGLARHQAGVALTASGYVKAAGR